VNVASTVVVVIVVGWSLVSILVAVAFGTMAKARDAGAPLLDDSLSSGRVPPPLHDEGVRPAV
jgi:hypothetical protein